MLIEKYEQMLRSAMLCSDTTALDNLLDDKLVFTAADGKILSKADDLAIHSSKLLKLERLDIYEMDVHEIGEMILVTAKANLAGHYSSTPFEGAYAYTRIWHQSKGEWTVIAGHASKIG